jgi:hypothetical protein
MGEGIGARPDRPERAKPCVEERLETFPLGADTLGAFKMQDAGERPAGVRLPTSPRVRIMARRPAASSACAISTCLAIGCEATSRGSAPGTGTS